MKNASIYVRNSHFYIVPLAYCAGVHINAEPIVVIADSVSDEALGQKILDTVALPEPEVANPDDSIVMPLFKAAKVRSWKAFINGTQSIFLEQDVDGTIKLLPTINNGKCFLFAPEKTRVVSADCPPAEIGKAVRHLFQEIIDATRVQIPLGRTFKKNR